MCLVSRHQFTTIVPWGGCLLACSVLIALGFWQLQRADHKKGLIELLESRRQEAPLRLAGETRDFENLLFHRVLVSGHYDVRHQFLLDNQVVDGRIGAFVLSPLKIDGSQQAVLINRGWVPMANRRVVDSDLNIPKPGVIVEGLVNHFPGVGYQLEGAEVPGGGWPGLIQVVDPETLSRILGYPVLPFQVLLNPDVQPGFVRKWKITYPVSPEKHRAYAIQWFLLAAILIATAVWNGVRSHE
ncbi:MAG: SURF1 family protein [Methylococcales bacterium]